MTVAEAAELYSVSKSTIYRWLRSGYDEFVRGEKVGRRWKLTIVSKEEKDVNEIHVDWRAVSYNSPSNSMPVATPWVHGLIENSKGPSARIQLAPQAGGGIIDLLFVAPDQAVAEAMDWDRGTLMTVDGHEVIVYKSMTVAEDWNCSGDENGLVWQLRAPLVPDHPLVKGAVEAAQPKQHALDEAERAFDDYAYTWSRKNFPHSDFMNTVRELELSEWKNRPDYWPGDPRPDTETILRMARKRLST